MLLPQIQAANVRPPQSVVEICDAVHTNSLVDCGSVKANGEESRGGGGESEEGHSNQHTRRKAGMQAMCLEQQVAEMAFAEADELQVLLACRPWTSW